MKTRITYYDILGIEPEASMYEIEGAYKQRVKELQILINDDSKTSKIKMDYLGIAYKILTDPFLREQYDRQMNKEHNKDHVAIPEKDQDREQNKADMQKKGSWWPVVAIILIVLIVPIISQINTSSGKSNKTVVPTLSVQNNPPLLSPTPLPSNYISCAPNSYLSNGVFCTCIPGFERNHNTGKCYKSVN